MNDQSPICLITSRHISYNPRLVKEADALHEAGFKVRVVAPSYTSAKAALDRKLMKTRGWSLNVVTSDRTDIRSTLRWLKASLRQRISQKLYPYIPAVVQDVAYSRYVSELATHAVAEPADLYIAHNLQALPAAHRAARRHDALLGFDAEDFHRGEFRADDASLQKALTEEVESLYLPQCDHVTAASEGIAEAYAKRLGIKPPTVVLNVFPREERSGHTPADELHKEKHEGTISLYWYSQVIGSDRGLQDMLRALPDLDEKIVLTLRGSWASGSEDVFRSLAHELGVAHRLRVLPPAPPEQLVERAAQHDIGLALEQSHTINRDLCVTNKILAYLLAGIPVIATATTGQRQICETVPAASRLVPVGNADAIASVVRDLTATDTRLAEAKAAAYAAGEERYNWEQERAALIYEIEKILALNEICK